MRIEWDSVEHHKAYLGSDLEKEIMAIFWPLIDTSHSPIFGHIPSDPSIRRTCFEAPIVEICTVYIGIFIISLFLRSGLLYLMRRHGNRRHIEAWYMGRSLRKIMGKSWPPLSDGQV
jgi:hypothetical protein